MKPITMYEAADGSRHETAEGARRREDLLVDVHVALRPLGDRPDDPGFSNGGGYVQHTAEAVRECKRALMRIAKEVTGQWDGLWDKHPDEVHPMSIAGRIINDSGNKPLDRAWGRLCCIDDQYREWGQPYFALHPEKGNPVLLSPVAR